MSRSGLEIPDFIAINEANAKALADTILLDELAEALYALASCVDVGEDDVED